MIILLRGLLPLALFFAGISETERNAPGIYSLDIKPVTDSLGMVVSQALQRTLELKEDHTFSEVNENFQCFARPLDRAGNWHVKGDTLVLEVKELYSKGEGGAMPLRFPASTTEQYRITTDRLTALHNGGDVLIRK